MSNKNLDSKDSLSEAWEAEVEYEEVSIEDLDNAVKAYSEARLDYDEKKKISNEADAIAKTAKKKLYELLGRAGKSKWEVDGLGSVSAYETYSFKTPKTASDKKLFAKYLEDKYGREQFWGMFSVNSRTLNSFLNQELKEHPESIIPGIEDPVAEEKITLRRKK